LGPEVRFYGGVNYGYGYGGVGFGGGRWNGGYFNYNTAVVRVNTTIIRNTYIDRTVITNVNMNRMSYNGGQGGINVRPNQTQIAAEHQKRFGPANTQVKQERVASQDKAKFASVNHGTPVHAALAKPAASIADFNHAVPAHGAKPVNLADLLLAQGIVCNRGSRPPRNDSVVENDVEQRLMNLDAAVVRNKAELAKAIHEEADPRPSGADHLRQRFLRDRRNQCFSFTRLAKLRQQ